MTGAPLYRAGDRVRLSGVYPIMQLHLVTMPVICLAFHCVLIIPGTALDHAGDLSGHPARSISRASDPAGGALDHSG